MRTKEIILSDSQLHEFEQNGYLLLERILDPTICKEFDVNIVFPALKQYAGIDANNSNSWTGDESISRLKSFATSDYNDNDKSNIVLPGVMVRKKDGCDPISDEYNLDLSPLEAILDQLHNKSDPSPENSIRNWEWIHENVGWIHVRFPIDDKNIEKRPENLQTWHVDGGHFSPHYVDSPEQSVIILPMIRPVDVGGGNTLVLQGSHSYIAQMLAESGELGVPKIVTQNMSNIAKRWPKSLIREVAPCNAGDVLLLHPFLIHSTGQAHLGHRLRITFNMGVRWKKEPFIDTSGKYNVLKTHEYRSWLEESITRSLNQSLSLDHPKET